MLEYSSYKLGFTNTRILSHRLSFDNGLQVQVSFHYVTLPSAHTTHTHTHTYFTSVFYMRNRKYGDACTTVGLVEKGFKITHEDHFGMRIVSLNDGAHSFFIIICILIIIKIIVQALIFFKSRLIYFRQWYTRPLIIYMVVE